MEKEIIGNVSDLNITDGFFKEDLCITRGFRLSERLDNYITEFSSIHGLSPSETIRLILTNYFKGDI